jgi:hypothetical protein
VITFDGDRSMKRRWFAEKKLALIHELDVPAKSLKWEGFTFKAWQQGEIDGGRVTAPAGAIVACSNTTGINLASADYWAGGFNAARPLHVVFVLPGEVAVNAAAFLANETAESMAEKGLVTVPFKPSVSSSPFGTVDGTTSGPSTVWVPDYSCAPVLQPNPPHESYRIMVSDEMDYDLNGNGIPEWHRQIFDRQPVFYIEDGSRLARKDGFTHHNESDINFSPRRIYQMPTSSTLVTHQSATYYDYVGGVKMVACRFDLAAASRQDISMASVLTSAMPSGLRSIMTDSPNDGSCAAIGSYAFAHNGEQCLLHVVNATTFLYDTEETESAAYAYYLANPSADQWRLFFSFSQGATVSLVNAAQFISLLDTLASDEVVRPGVGVNWFNAQRMLTQLAGAWPNNKFSVPYDSAMFHGHDGNVYTWTRAYGSVRFSPSGLFAETLIVPAAVIGETGVRPEIFLVGSGPQYICICNKPTSGVRAVGYGSPFTGWIMLEPVPDGYSLKHARLAGINETTIVFIGVAQGLDSEGEPAYFFARIVHSFADGGEWKILGRTPFAVGDYDNFSCSIFGNTPDVKAMMDVPVYPPIVPQSPVGPYSLYSIGMP